MRKLLFGTIILAASLAFITGNGNLTSANGKLSGVVTYKDYYEFTNSADAGSEIYAISEADVNGTQYSNFSDVMGTYQNKKSDYSLALYNNTLDIARIQKLQDNFDIESKFASDYINGFKKLPDITKALADAKGNYTLSLKPGKYYILFVSGSIKSNNIVESQGNIAYRIANVIPSGDSFLGVNFEKSQNIMILLMTAVNREGC